MCSTLKLSTQIESRAIELYAETKSCQKVAKLVDVLVRNGIDRVWHEDHDWRTGGQRKLTSMYATGVRSSSLAEQFKCARSCASQWWFCSGAR